MTAVRTAGGRLRAYFEFVAAVFYFFLARALAHTRRRGWPDDWTPLVEQAMLVFLLLVGLRSHGILASTARRIPSAPRDFRRAHGLAREIGHGPGHRLGPGRRLRAAHGRLRRHRHSVLHATAAWGWLVADAAFFALARWLRRSLFAATVSSALPAHWDPSARPRLCGLLRIGPMPCIPGSSRASFAVSVALGLVLSAAYLRTRALWLSWGLNFGWKASRALLFGLAVSGVQQPLPRSSGRSDGPVLAHRRRLRPRRRWLAFFVLLAAIPVVFRITRDLDFRYNAPVLVPGGNSRRSRRRRPRPARSSHGRDRARRPWRWCRSPGHRCRRLQTDPQQAGRRH